MTGKKKKKKNGNDRGEEEVNVRGAGAKLLVVADQPGRSFSRHRNEPRFVWGGGLRFISYSAASGWLIVTMFAGFQVVEGAVLGCQLVPPVSFFSPG